uniref:C2 and GRAM domain-containing protein n=1 Tax=Kalanchoe fedtschenkoi TaxID=63787 RepID=A0A7N0UD40_KALFE
MKLVVRVIEARNLPALDLNGFSDPYVRLQIGRQRSRTKVVKKSLNPSWGEEFSFRVEDLSEELLISVLDEDRYFNDDFIGLLKFPVSDVFDNELKSLGTAWYSLKPKDKTFKNKECGEILLSIYFASNNYFTKTEPSGNGSSLARRSFERSDDSPLGSPRSYSQSPSPMRFEGSISAREEKASVHKGLTGRFAKMFNKTGDTTPSSTSLRGTDLPEILEEDTVPGTPVTNSEDQFLSSFVEMIGVLESKDQGTDMPSNLPGGVLLDQLYMISPQDLNILLHSPESDFYMSLADLQGTTEVEIGRWKFENEGSTMKRVLTYVKAATKLIKAVKGTEEQTYLKADGKNFAVLASVSTPDVMYGNTFKVELLFCITPGPEIPSGEQSSRLLISWRMNFVQSTMMKSMIEGGARQGLKDSYAEYASLLSQKVKPLDSKDLGSNKEQLLTTMQAEPQSDWKLAVQYFANFTVLSAVVVGLYVAVHIFLALPSTLQGIEFVGLDLPDSVGELIVSGILVLQGKQVLEFIARFMQARVQKGTDHGVKAQGKGWLLTVALMEGSSLAAVDSSGFSDPYVVFTCNGKTRTSSIKFQKCDPLWNEIFEFDAMDEPPSVLDVDVFDFDGPFDEATSLGHAEVNFVKTNISDLADVWVPLRGNLAQAHQSKLHLRIFLNDSRGSDVVRNYLTKMEKEVGQKINVRSPQTNSAFQKMFCLPPEEFLINDFTCHLKRKMPFQGRLFLSARIIGFYGNLFGQKTKFFFLWEDIEDIQVLPPTLASMGSPIIVMTLRVGRGMDAKHGAKTQDEEGRLKFHFQTFVSFNVAHKTIMALWKAKSLSPEQKVLIVDEQSETKTLQSEESGSLLVDEDVSMSEVYSCAVPIPAEGLIRMFDGGELEDAVMTKSGYVEYSHTPWEMVKADTFQRQIYFKFPKNLSRYRGEVTSTQQKYPIPDKNGWVIEEVMTLHGVPLGDHFTLHLKYQIEDLPPRSQGQNVHVFFGISWLKSTRHQKRITKNIVVNLQERLKVQFITLEKEYAAGK